MQVTKYEEYGRNIIINGDGGERVIMVKLNTEGLTEEESEKIRREFNMFCEKLKEI